MDNKRKLIENYIYFFHLDKFCVLPMYPESVTDSLQSKFADTNALSRTAPVFTYIESGPRSINIALSMHRDMMNDVNRNVSNLKDNVVDFSGDDYIDVLIKYLQASVLPKYRNYSSSSRSVIPPMVAVRFGNDIFIKGVVNGPITVTYGLPILENSKYALVNVGFNIYETDPYDAESILADGSFRGITRSFKDGIYKSNYVGPNITTEKSTVDTGVYKPKTIQSVDSSVAASYKATGQLYSKSIKRTSTSGGNNKVDLNKLTQKKAPIYTGGSSGKVMVKQ